MKEVAPSEIQERWPIGRAVVKRIRADVNDPMSPLVDRGVEDPFTQLYLRERDGCVPDELVDEDLISGIRSMYCAVLDGVCAELRERAAPQIPMNIVIDASYDDKTTFVVHIFDKVLLSGGMKAWNFFWDSEDEMAKDMEDWYHRAATAVARRPEPAPSVDGRYRVTLNLERVFDIAAATAHDALEEAARWESNENDPQVQLDYEEIVWHQVVPAGKGAETPDGGDG